MRERFRGKNTDIKKLGDVVHNTVISIKKAGKQNKSLREKWERAAGEVISNHTEVRMVKGGVLYIEVDSATWLHYIVSFKKKELLKSLQEEFKKQYISEVKFRVGII